MTGDRSLPEWLPADQSPRPVCHLGTRTIAQRARRRNYRRRRDLLPQRRQVDGPSRLIANSIRIPIVLNQIQGLWVVVVFLLPLLGPLLYLAIARPRLIEARPGD